MIRNISEIEPLLEVPFFNFHGFNCRNSCQCWEHCEPNCHIANYDKHPLDDYWDKTPLPVYQGDV